ncbi:MAG: AMP-binding protein [Flavobacteriales bacterium]
MTDPRTGQGNLITLLENELTSDPGSPAIVTDGVSLSYRALGVGSSRISEALRSFGIRADRTVGLCLDRSPELIISVLGIVQAGAAYLPIDPTYPAERIAGMLEDAKPPVVITNKAHEHLFKGTNAKVLLIEEIDLSLNLNPLSEGEGASCPAGPDNLAYVLFTSGSTGRPKGVAMHHAPLMNLIQWQLRTSVCGEGDRTLQSAPISFDVSFQEIFTTSAQGGTLVPITDEDRLNSTQLLRKIISEEASTASSCPSLRCNTRGSRSGTGEVPLSLKEAHKWRTTEDHPGDHQPVQATA